MLISVNKDIGVYLRHDEHTLVLSAWAHVGNDPTDVRLCPW